MQNENDDPNIPSERQSFLKLTRDIAALPLEQSAAAPEVTKILEAEELREWGELGRRLAMSDVEMAVSFFTAGVTELQTLSREARASLFQLCSRQLGLSIAIALETFRAAPALSSSISDPNLLTAVFEEML